MEIAAEQGRLVMQNWELKFTRNEIPVSEHSRTTKEGFQPPPAWDITIPVSGSAGHHVEIMQNFINAIREGVPLIAPAEEGIRSVELANAMLYSSDTKQTIELPLDSATYAAWLQEKAKPKTT